MAISYTQFLERLKLYRTRRKITQQQLADHIGLGAGSQISVVESNNGELPVRRFLEICDLFDLAPEVFFVEHEYATLAEDAVVYGAKKSATSSLAKAGYKAIYNKLLRDCLTMILANAELNVPANSSLTYGALVRKLRNYLDTNLKELSAVVSTGIIADEDINNAIGVEAHHRDAAAS